MEFEKGKFYELESEIVAILQYVGLSPLSKDTFIYTYCSIDQLIGFDCSISEYDKVINTFDNIHEVSKRIKEIEEKQKFVGLIYECDCTNLTTGSYDHSIIEVVEANYITEEGFDGRVKILKNISVNECDKNEYKEGNVIDYSVMFEFSKELTQEQYEQRLKELEKEEIKLSKPRHFYKDNMGNLIWVLGHNEKDSEYPIIGVDLLGDQYFNYDCFQYVNLDQEVPELEAIKILTGKDYVLLEDGQKQIKQLQEENKQLRKALEFHGVWPSEDQRAVGNIRSMISAWMEVKKPSSLVSLMIADI